MEKSRCDQKMSKDIAESVEDMREMTEKGVVGQGFLPLEPNCTKKVRKMRKTRQKWPKFDGDWPKNGEK